MFFSSIFGKPRSISDTGYLQGKTDRHSHILYGVDDGMKTLEGALDALSYMEGCGISELWCTPHVMEDVPNATEFLKQRFDELKAAYAGNIKLHLAAEYMLDNLFEKRLKERDLLTMEDDIVLVETSTINPPVNLYEILGDMKRVGYMPLLAHPERYRYLGEEDYMRLKQMGIKFQMNISSVVGFYGETARKKALWLLGEGYYDEIGSDCHRLNTTKKQFEHKVLKRKDLSLLKLQ